MLLSFCLNPIAFVALLYRRTLFRMIIERIALALSRLKQGFDSPRERQQTQALRSPLAAFVE